MAPAPVLTAFGIAIRSLFVMALDAFSLECERVVAQLILQADAMDLELVHALPFYKYQVRDLRAGDQAPLLIARCLPSTWSLYEQRFWHAARTIDLLIVREQNALPPVPHLRQRARHYYDADAVDASERAE